MFANAPRLFRIFGIDIRVHPSWLIVFLLVTWSLAVGNLPDAIPGIDPTAAWTLGALAALLFFGSVLLHEISHSLVARSRGVGVHSITLFIFGGVSSLTGDARTAGTEFAIAVVGPVTSLVIGGLALGAALLIDGATSGGAVPVTTVLSYVGMVNALVGAFNLIPGFPLDGGRVLRSAIWRLTGSMARATRIAAGAGQLVAGLFLLYGLYDMFVNGSVLGGIWIAAIGWFLLSAASSSVEQLAIDRAVGDVRVRDVLRPGTVTIRPDVSIEDAVRWTLLPYGLQSVPVVDGRVVGILSIDDVRRVPAELREQTQVARAMRPAAGLATVSPEASLREALNLLDSTEAQEVPVVEDGRLLGLLTRAEIMHAVQLRRELRPAA